jgi:LPXTG-site transpeptidase (sortase) family protein
LEGGQQVDERPAQPLERRQPSLAGPVPGNAVGYRLASQVLAIIAVLSLSFLIELTLLGNLSHDRDQAENFGVLRQQLADGTAPVAPVDEANRPLAAGTPVAIIEIPRLGLNEVVVEGTSSRTMRSGPGHRRDTVLPGQVGTSVILGRRAAYGGPFGSLDGLRAGDEVVVTTGQGRHTFTVLGVRRVGSPLPPPLLAGQGRLTLTTADGAKYRPTDVLRVDAALTSAAQSTPTQLPPRSLPANEAIGVGDTSALVWVVLWSAALVAGTVGMVWVRYRTGLWQVWIIGVPVAVTLGLSLFDDIAALLPNLM